MKISAIEVSGNILSQSLIENLSREDSRNKYVEPQSFMWFQSSSQDTVDQLEARIKQTYQRLLDYWDKTRFDLPNISAEQFTSEWTMLVIKEIGFVLNKCKSPLKSYEKIDFAISHRGWKSGGAPIIHIVSKDIGLGDRIPGSKYSPHDLVQQYLNQTKTENWGVVTNGLEIRLIHDFYHQTRKGYVSFNLEDLFDARLYKDFRVLYRLLHPSRFCKDKTGLCVLDNLFEESKAAGVAVGDDLRDNIKLAIEQLANGFLADNSDLVDELIDNDEKSKAFYQQILRVIYRLVFLLYAEQRNLISSHSSIYFQDYSITHLRSLAESSLFNGDHHRDLWEGLKVTFTMVYKGVPDLGIPAYGGMLFGREAISLLIDKFCRNDFLIQAIKYLTVIEKDGGMQRISYSELSVDEIGAIYESLLEFIPRISSQTQTFEDIIKENGRSKKGERVVNPRTFFLDPRGTNRKTSGSYYTNPSLVNALIESALIPVVQDRLQNKTGEAAEEALLSIKVCDPACGSGAFLIGATETLGKILAEIRCKDALPSDDEIRLARRDVLGSCIYGVDLNPMVVELAKLSLWLTAATPDHPLNFLDSKIKQGNSLVGATPDLIKKGIPPEAYDAVIGDNSRIANERKKIIKDYYGEREQNKNQLSFVTGYGDNIELTLQESCDYKTIEDVEQAKSNYLKLRNSEEFQKEKYIADYWTSAFFWSNTEFSDFPNPGELENLLKNKISYLKDKKREKVNEYSIQNSFFHWYLEFPEVFQDGGFDCILGNPPWEKFTIFEREFFVGKDDIIANTQNKSKRTELINDLAENNPQLWLRWLSEQQSFANTSKWLKKSNKYPLSASGELNTYPIFVELSRDIINESSKVGLIVKSALATSISYSYLFSDLLKNNQIESFYDFKNWELLFPAIGFHERFALITLCGTANSAKETTYAFECLNVEDINPEKVYSLKYSDISIFNPNTNTCPVFLSRRDIAINRKVYSKFPILVDETKGINKWGISYIRAFDMSNDSKHFLSKEELISKNYNRDGCLFTNKEYRYFPLYEGKFIQNYDFRFSSFENSPKETRFGKKPATHTPTLSQKSDSTYEIESRYWMSEEVFNNMKKAVNLKYPYQFTCRLVTNVISNARTCIGCIMPSYPTNNLCLVLNFISRDQLEYTRKLLLFNSIFSSFLFDYVARQKVTENLLKNVLWQLPFPELNEFKNYSVDGETLDKYLISRVVSLTVCTNSLLSINQALGTNLSINSWDYATREKNRVEIDSVVALLYGIDHNDLEYIFDTFPIVKKKEIDKYGEYRSKRLILEKYDELKDKFNFNN